MFKVDNCASSYNQSIEILLEKFHSLKSLQNKLFIDVTFRILLNLIDS